MSPRAWPWWGACCVGDGLAGGADGPGWAGWDTEGGAGAGAVPALGLVLTGAGSRAVHVTSPQPPAAGRVAGPGRRIIAPLARAAAPAIPAMAARHRCRASGRIQRGRMVARCCGAAPVRRRSVPMHPLRAITTGGVTVATRHRGKAAIQDIGGRARRGSAVRQRGVGVSRP